ncbi:hypothetical protein B0H16DRAFT_1380719, partial [Mycena metata]
MDAEKGTAPQDTYVDPSHEAAAVKLWAVYISEAEKYDRGLVESWKSDMEGMLIFAGLFSASLTAFLIESYKSLSPDSGHMTVVLLTQISHQLAAAANGTSFTVSPCASFTPPPTSLVCNVLWFISLGLSLTCALIATLLEQWARDFLHKADIRSAPVIRARLFSYLYYGIRRFGMHTVVDIVPLLLHVSLLLFFGGLVAFLIPINTAVTAVAGILLAIMLTVYSLLTLLPLVDLDCPYRTPLSSALWRIIQKLPRVLPHRNRTSKAGHLAEAETMVEAMFRNATAPSAERSNRDRQSIIWTVKSLADDAELEPFLEAIPDVLWGPNGRRYVYDDTIRELIDHPDVRLLKRIQGLTNTCTSGLLSSEVRQRRSITCYKAIWSIGMLSTSVSSSDQVFPTPTPYNIHPEQDQDPDVLHYAVSAAAVSRFGTFCAAQGLLQKALQCLALCKLAIAEGQTPDISPVLDCLQSLESYSIFLRHNQPKDSQAYFSFSAMIERLLEEINHLSLTVPFEIFIEYLGQAARLNSPPHQFRATRALICPPQGPLSPTLLRDLEATLNIIVAEQLPRVNTAMDTDVSWLDD